MRDQRRLSPGLVVAEVKSRNGGRRFLVGLQPPGLSSLSLQVCVDRPSRNEGSYSSTFFHQFPGCFAESLCEFIVFTWHLTPSYHICLVTKLDAQRSLKHRGLFWQIEPMSVYPQKDCLVHCALSFELGNCTVLRALRDYSGTSTAGFGHSKVEFPSISCVLLSFYYC